MKPSKRHTVGSINAEATITQTFVGTGLAIASFLLMIIVLG
jgi:hypothetical protein